MIAISDILIFLAGAGLMYVALLTHRHFYGKRMVNVSNLPQASEEHKPRKVVTELPEVETDRLGRLIHQINTHNEFGDTYSRRVKESKV